ncbi:MAG: hypothetical protein HC811_03085 [Flammeovirgaceae bacterium]|nr:hypothetical protein [Flammeovirgaceae bacterium]
METHKRILGILFVITGAFQLIILTILSIFFSTIFSFALSQVDGDERMITETILGIVRFIPMFIIIFISIPSLIAGAGLLSKQKWAMILALIIGCLKLFSFPVGTALGIYTIWVYAEDQKQLNPS